MSINSLRQSFVIIAVVLAGAGSVYSQTPPVTRTLTIEEAVSIANDRNLTIELARSRVNTAGARVTSSFGTFLPQINISSGYTRQLSDGTVVVQGTPIPGNRPPDNLSANISASVLLFDGFARTATYSASQSDLTASMETLNRTKEDVAFQTRSAFLNVLRSDQIVEVRRNDIELNREQLVRARGLVESGAAQVGTVYSQEAELANAELALEQASTDVIIARNTLEQILNLDPAVEVRASAEGLASSVDSLEILESRGALGSFDDMLRRQRENRKDIRAAQLAVESAGASVKAARGNYYPQVSASVGYGWQRAGDIRSGNSSFGLNLNYTPFDGFRTNEQVQLAEAQRQSAEIELRRLELQAQSELQQSLARLDGAERQLRAASKAVTAARQSRFAADERYKVGLGNYVDYLLANSQYLSAQINQVNAVFNFRLALYEVRYQLGE